MFKNVYQMWIVVFFVETFETLVEASGSKRLYMKDCTKVTSYKRGLFSLNLYNLVYEFFFAKLLNQQLALLSIQLL